MGFTDRIKHAWDAFLNDEEEGFVESYSGAVNYGPRPDRPRFTVTNERSIVSSVYTRLSIDVAAVEIRHVRLDKQGRYLEDINSGLHRCLTLEANIDQAATQFRQDIVQTLISDGVAAIVPVVTDLNPELTGAYDIKDIRVGSIKAWQPQHVIVSLYNEKRGIRQDIRVAKQYVAIVENPLYSVMNEPSSTLQRLIRKLDLLDAVDEQSGSGKLDMIIQLPYVIKSEARRQQADQRRKDIEMQLRGSQYGIAYTDGTEKITQLNRPAENNLLAQIEFLTGLLYNQLGLTEAVMNGTADEAAMLNYNNRTVKPIVKAVVEAMRRTFLTNTARAQNQSIEFFRSPFDLVPVDNIADMADKFTRNEILTSNEFRQILGFKPSSDPKADKLQNSNMPQPDQEQKPEPGPKDGVGNTIEEEEGDSQ